MVKIQNLDELKRIQESNFGFIITRTKNLPPTIHQPTCKSVKKEDFESNLRENQDSEFFWFSSISLAEKEIEGIVMCKNCNS